jgi:hypothetical protein
MLGSGPDALDLVEDTSGFGGGGTVPSTRFTVWQYGHCASTPTFGT